MLGHKSDKTVVVTDAIPLFHTRVMSGSLEIAFDMIETTMTNEKTKIVGVYEAPLYITNYDLTASSLA